MLAVSGIGTSTVSLRTTRQPPAGSAEARPTPGRALVPVQPPAAKDRISTATPRPLAAFLAHLIATRAQDPQTRTRRKAEPEHAIAAYSAHAVPGASGRRFAGEA